MTSLHVSFRPFDPVSLHDCKLIAKWENDPEIREMFQVFKDAESLMCLSTSESVAERYRSSPDNSSSGSFMIILDGEPVGEINFFMDRRPIISDKLKTAWAGIVIGEAHARGKGVGRLAMQELERRARLAGAERVELGVFEFNDNARAFYKKLGYREFARLPNFVYFRGRMWDDIRMIKEFQ